MTWNVRFLQEEDIPCVSDLAYSHLLETRSDLVYLYDKKILTQNLIDLCCSNDYSIGAFVVGPHENLRGYLLVRLHTYLYSFKKVVNQEAFFVPKSFRSGPWAYKLLRSLLSWSKKHGVNEIYAIGSSEDFGLILQRMGFDFGGYCWRMRF